ncbi:MAG TPA: hypothetical protein P5121_13300 [Caldilineaceae bacterium]|nr:hypothetical protein [Caldilineaceae bacterium]
MSEQERATAAQEADVREAAVHDAEVQEAEGKVDPQSVARAHELNDINFRAIALFGLALLVVILLSLFILRWLTGTWTDADLRIEAQIPPAVGTAPAAPGPGVEAVPATELNHLLAPQRKRLTSYGWIDKEAGTVHVPIERAMELLLAEGVPAREGDPPAFTLPPAYQLDGSGGQEVTTP